MINALAAIQEFRRYTLAQKHTKILLLIGEIVRKSGKMKDLFILLQQVTNIPESVYDSLYETIMQFGADIEYEEIAKMLGRTQSILQKIWDQEAYERGKEQICLDRLLASVDDGSSKSHSSLSPQKRVHRRKG